MALIVDLFTGDDPPSDEVVEADIVFADASRPMLPRPATFDEVEQLLPSLLGPTDDLPGTVAVLGSFPALDDLPADLEIVMVEHRVDVSSDTRLSVAFVTSDDVTDTKVRIERALEAVGAPVARPIAGDTFPDERRSRPRNRNEWVEVVGVELDDGRSWIGLAYRTRLQDMFPEPLWRSDLASDDAGALETLIRVAVPTPGAPEPMSPFADTAAGDPAAVTGSDATVVVFETLGNAGSFEDSVEWLQRSDRWFAGVPGEDIDVTEVYIDPVGAREFVTDDRRAQLIVATGRSVGTVFTMLAHARVVSTG